MLEVMVIHALQSPKRTFMMLRKKVLNLMERTMCIHEMKKNYKSNTMTEKKKLKYLQS